MNDNSELKRDCDKPINDETFFLLSLSSLISLPTTTNSNRIDPQYMQTIASNSNSNNNNNNRIACGATNTMAPIAASASSLTQNSSATIVHTCCYKHHCQLSACHINNGEFQANTTKKLLLSIPLQRKRKKVVYNRDFIGAIGIDQRNRTEFSLTNGDQRLIISHLSCVEKFTKMNSSINPVASTTQQIQQTIEDNTTSLNVSDSTKCAENVRKSSNSSLTADEGYLAMASPYSSSGEDEDNRNGNHLAKHERVERSASSDSALGLDEDILANGMADLPTRRNIQRRMTLTVSDIPLRPALLPVAEPTSLPDSPLPVTEFIPSTGQSPVVVPSKMLLEARVVEIPSPLPSPSPMLSNSEFTKFSYFDPTSRRESNVSDCDDIVNRVRIVRTPSVVVSDYSDDVLCGITLEELEYFRQQRKLSLGATLDCSSPYSSATDNTHDTDYLSDLSAASSCSNLNYCGSTISVLDDNYTMVSGLQTPERKLSNCSTCSTPSGVEDNDDYNNTDVFSSNLIEALNQQQNKKVCKCKLNQQNTKTSNHLAPTQFDECKQ